MNKFIMFLRKGVCPFKYMNESESLMKHHCQKKMTFVVT